MFNKIRIWFQSLRHFVICDPQDNSVVLSKRLFLHIKKNVEAGAPAKVFVFRIPERETFGFMTDPDIDTPTQLCDIQYNDKYKCIGFESLCPSVGRMLYDYGLSHETKVKLSVTVRRTNGRIYYEFDKPHGKYIR